MTTQTSITPVPFLGSEVATSYDKAQVVILPVPFEATTSYRQGCQEGPAAILAASQQVEYYDDELEQEVWPIGIYTHPAIANTGHGPVTSEAMLQEIQETLQQLVQAGKFVITLGGEHSITAGVVAAYQQANPNQPFTVVQIDAHGDLRHDYEGSIYNHACVMRRIVDLGLPTVQVGIRSLCQEEADLIKAKGLIVLRAQDIATQPDWCQRALSSIPTQQVFLTIDLDGIDPAAMPGVGTPEPGGLSWFSILSFLRQLFTAFEVIGCDVMELAPIAGSVVSEFTAAKLVYKLIGYHAVTANSPLTGRN